MPVILISGKAMRFGKIKVTCFFVANHPYIFENADIVVLLKLIPDLKRGEWPSRSQFSSLSQRSKKKK